MKLRVEMKPETSALLDRVDGRLDLLGLSDRRASLAATGKVDTIRNLRRGHPPSFDKLCALAKALGVSVDYLMTGQTHEGGAMTAVASAGTKMFRRGDVLGVLSKLIAKAHEEIDALYECERRAAAAVVQARLGAYYKVRDAIYEVPIFENTASAIEARRAETGTGSVHESAVGESRDAEPGDLS